MRPWLQRCWLKALFRGAWKSGASCQHQPVESRKQGRVRAKRSPGTARVQGRKQGRTMPSPSWPTLA